MEIFDRLFEGKKGISVIYLFEDLCGLIKKQLLQYLIKVNKQYR